MLNRLRQIPFFLFLMPVFFVFHGFVENFYFIPVSDCLLLIAVYCFATILIYGCFYLIVRKKVNASLITIYIMGFYLFFGAFHDQLRIHGFFLHRYSILLPAFIAGIILLIIYLKKNKNFPRLSLFLNALFLIYLILDCGTLVRKVLAPSGRQAPTSPFASNPYHYCESCEKPDIYFFLFDCYSGNRTLKDEYHYDNGGLDNFLDSEGFHIQKESRSNYYITPFSMASMLNFSYLKEIPDPLHLTPDDYLNVLEPIRKNEVVRFLNSNGYAIINNSPFDLEGNPADLGQPFFPVKARLITNRTLFAYMARDMEWLFKSKFKIFEGFEEGRWSETYRFNTHSLDKAQEESRKTAEKPRFVYTHVFMPHVPFLFDSLQRRRCPELTGRPSEMGEKMLKPYLDYLPYTNSCIRKILSSVKRNTGGKAVIIFMSDHGLRYTTDGKEHAHYFNNQNAVFFPDNDYHMLYDSISGVNMFRVVLNKLFRQNFPLLKDSLIYLRDMK